MSRIGIILAILFLWVSTAGAGTMLRWDYPDPPSDLAGFKVYLNEETVAFKDIQDPEARSISLSSASWDDANNTVIMTAYDTAGQESARSEPCAYNPVPIPVTNVTIKTEVVNIYIGQ